MFGFTSRRTGSRENEPNELPRRKVGPLVAQMAADDTDAPLDWLPERARRALTRSRGRRAARQEKV